LPSSQVSPSSTVPSPQLAETVVSVPVSAPEPEPSTVVSAPEPCVSAMVVSVPVPESVSST
jgi:hypothetical protein